MSTHRQDAIVQAGVRWAESDERVRALLLKGSLARGDADERSDIDMTQLTDADSTSTSSLDRIAEVFPGVEVIEGE